ncbi:1-acyl-sn-glycerol-3-phosphate acyltransferase [Endozoicomonas arenosclerae]|uniref:1-acyl-sn-glycerol-3-phosphate acyltransferase n=1 Tax=Endozoicomonas arenosclerae TaxID=1633495 RepID=UPI000A96C897|nr:1-acyl-sn-glycerol-3-phosphate acyltransferase [Endozoicomonas arenosclerae]
MTVMKGNIPEQMERFEEIRPYHDHEVRPALERLLHDRELIQALVHHQYPRVPGYLSGLAGWLTSMGLRYKLKDIHNIEGLQQVIEPYLTRVIEGSTAGISFSGLDKLDKSQAHLFLSNHRDIVMDPAFVNLAVYRHGMETVRIAIGDNLLQRPFVSDLMRLNKSFIVKRSVEGRREKLRAYQTLSAYIHHSIDSGHPVWIAQSEGRAKDGDDKTDSAIIKMFHMSRKAADTSFADSIRSMNMVPVSIAYEYDPCDTAKAKELYETEKHGNYEKFEGEDMQSIVTGIEGFKGRVHVSFGTPLTEEYENANQVVEEVDRQVHQNYHLFASNLIAFDRIRSEFPEVTDQSLEALFERFCPEESRDSKIKEFNNRLAQCPEDHQHWFLKMYANPVINYFRLKGH